MIVIGNLNILCKSKNYEVQNMKSSKLNNKTLLATLRKDRNKKVSLYSELSAGPNRQGEEKLVLGQVLSIEFRCLLIKFSLNC